MIVDTSAVIAILHGEPDAAGYAAALEASPVNRISAATWLEVGIVIDATRDPLVSRRFDEILSEGAFVVEPVTETQVRIARDAYRDFGQGSGHPAGLNFGDCFAYALARELGEPLLFKGDDFRHTDIPFVGRPAERRRLQELLAPYEMSGL